VAPAVFLLAVTVVALVVRSALRSDTSGAATTRAVVSTSARPQVSPGASSAPKRYYIVASGDTLDRIAARFETTVDALLRLNPGVEPTALIPGEQVRIR
jgi:LysM repeat protein